MFQNNLWSRVFNFEFSTFDPCRTSHDFDHEGFVTEGAKISSSSRVVLSKQAAVLVVVEGNQTNNQFKICNGLNKKKNLWKLWNWTKERLICGLENRRNWRWSEYGNWRFLLQFEKCANEELLVASWARFVLTCRFQITLPTSYVWPSLVKCFHKLFVYFERISKMGQKYCEIL